MNAIFTTFGGVRGSSLGFDARPSRPPQEVAMSVIAVLYSVEEAAEALRLSRSRIYELIRSGKLRTVKAGRRRLVPVAALDEFVAMAEEG